MSFLEVLAVIALVGVWGWVLGRPLIMSAMNRAQRDPIAHFSSQRAAATGMGMGSGLGMGAVAGARPLGAAGPYRPPSLGQSLAPRSARKRRLQLMMALGMATAMSALLALVFQGIFVSQLVLLLVLLVAYVGLAAAAGNREAERRQKVTYLGAGQSAPMQARVRAASDV